MKHENGHIWHGSMAMSASLFGWIAMELCTEIYVSQRMIPTDFGDSLTFSLVQP